MDNKNKNILILILKIIGIYIVFEIVAYTLGSVLASVIYSSIFTGRYTIYIIREFVVLVLAIITSFILHKGKIFKKKKTPLKEAILVCMPIVILSAVVFISNIISLILAGESLNIANFINIIVYSITIGLFEEIFFRGIIEEELLNNYHKNKKQIIIAILISALLFGGIHLTNLLAGQDITTTIMQVIQTIAIGFLFGVTYYITRNIWALAFLHGVYDFSVLLGSVNELKDCNYASNLPTSVIAQSIIASVILSAIYLIYAIYLLKKNNDVEQNKKIKDKYITVIIILIVTYFFTNIAFSLLSSNDINDYYICYDYPSIDIEKVETHYFNYDDYNLILTDSNNEFINLSISLNDNYQAILKDNTTDEKIVLMNNVIKIISYNNLIILIVEENTNYKIYYYDYLTSDNLLKNNILNNLKDNYTSYDIPEVVGGGYLKDVNNDITYPMIKGRTQDLFIIKDDSINIVN